jgi:ABC-type nitrate/sulfonate/bicarbonate transport system permease component
VKTVNRDLLRAAAMAGANEAQLLRFVVLPAAMPSIFAGLRIGVGTAWMLTVTAEMVAVKSGLGYSLWDSYYFLRYDLVIASMISIDQVDHESPSELAACWHGSRVTGLENFYVIYRTQQYRQSL